MPEMLDTRIKVGVGIEGSRTKATRKMRCGDTGLDELKPIASDMMKGIHADAERD